MAKNIRQPIAVITGAAGGIGKATVLRFVREGYRVAALDYSKSSLARLKRTKAGASVETYFCDLVETDTLTPLAQQIVSEMGDPRAMVNNAGISLYADITELTDETWLRSLNVNLVGAAALVRGFVPSMKRVNGAAIVNVSSRNALSSSPRAAAYDASKAGLLALTRTLGVELGPDGIRVNAVLPGFIDTPVHGDLLKDQVYTDNYLKLIPLNRFGKPKDMASIIYFLASDEAAFITGQGIVADGGQMSGQNYERLFGKRKSLQIRQEKDG
jgi:NAD(P)-dependent dehydrogenase (short-subunit alcohol dehydrogenase family)